MNDDFEFDKNKLGNIKSMKYEKDGMCECECVCVKQKEWEKEMYDWSFDTYDDKCWMWSLYWVWCVIGCMYRFWFWVILFVCKAIEFYGNSFDCLFIISHRRFSLISAMHLWWCSSLLSIKCMAIPTMDRSNSISIEKYHFNSVWICDFAHQFIFVSFEGNENEVQAPAAT